MPELFIIIFLYAGMSDHANRILHPFNKFSYEKNYIPFTNSTFFWLRYK